MSISIFDLFSIGIGPSSSHTMGPMRAAKAFLSELINQQQLNNVARVQVDLYGSLALTGKGHGTDFAIMHGLQGEFPELIDPDAVLPGVEKIRQSKQINLHNEHLISFEEAKDMLFHQRESLPLHANGMRFSGFDAAGNLIDAQVYYSIGGGFIVTEEQFGKNMATMAVPYPFETAEELLNLCKKNQLTIAQLMLANESAMRPKEAVIERLHLIDQTMAACIEKGCQVTGTLPGFLKVKRRASDLYQKLIHQGLPKPGQYADIMNWLNIYAMAVNEENAAGGRVVTAPTNGAAGVVPAVLQYYKHFCEGANQEGIENYLLTAGAIAILYKSKASISGAEVGCQGEVGSASSMAAGALAAVLGGSLEQIENAAEIAMEHHLGMTCDPVGGLVQIPCIERNAMAAVKSVNAARLALLGDGEHKVSLDKVIKTMYQTGKDMLAIYKETSQGGLAVNVTEC